MFYKHDTRIFNILFNIKKHLDNDWDYLLVVVGDTGTGKSMWCLHLLEEWYKHILGKNITPELAKQLSSDYQKWLKNFRELDSCGLNAYDEGATSLEAKQHLTKLSKDLTKLFNVFRSKKFFTVIVIPSFFYLNKYFRENRLRGLVWIDKRGHYKFYTKLGISYLNAYNERRIVKSMFVAHPVHSAGFPDYKGVLRGAYEGEKDKLVDKVLEEVISNNAVDEPKVTKVNLYKDDVARLLKAGKTHREIRDELQLAGTSFTQILFELKKDSFKT